MSDKDRSNKLLVVIGGPTGIGKTLLAIRLARHYKTEIINADSRQVYSELIIGVGRPAPEQLAMVPHHLIGHTSIFNHYTAGDYTRDALNVLSALFDHHDIVFLTGGTGLYIKGIIDGFDQMPDIPEEVTSYWTALWKERGLNPLIAALEKYDPDYLKTVDRSNPSRIIRAVSLSAHTGKPFSSFHTGQPVPRPFEVLPIVLEMPRKELYARIDQRVLDMIGNGWLEEAKSLLPFKHLKGLQTVGYKELFRMIEGELTLEETISQIQQASRRYAKRQMTWWRNQGEWYKFHPDDITAMIQFIDAHKMKS